MSIGLVAMNGGEETTSQRRGGAGGNQTDRGRETVTDTESEAHSPLNKLRDSSMMSGAGKTVSGAKKTKSRNLGSREEGATAQVPRLLKRRNPTLNCRGL